jgi:rhodanese-related sulfurtransferase
MGAPHVGLERRRDSSIQLNVIDSPRSAALSHYGELARVAKALASPARLKLVDLLRQGSRTVDVLAQAAGLSVANSSQHLQILRRANVLTAERQGQSVKYRLSDEAVSRVFASVRDLAETLLPEMDRLRRQLEALDPHEREALLARIRAGEVMLLDVRPAEEWSAGHLPGALSIPLAELSRRLSELPRDREVVAYCRGPYCSLAVEAVALLRSSGYRARHLDLGIPELKARRFRISSGGGAPLPLARAGPPPDLRRRRSRPNRTPRKPR